MLDEKEFNLKAAQLVNKLTFLWAFVYQTKTGKSPLREEFDRVLSEANKLHSEMFPDFEHSLYSDDFISMIEDVSDSQ